MQAQADMSISVAVNDRPVGSGFRVSPFDRPAHVAETMLFSGMAGDTVKLGVRSGRVHFGGAMIDIDVASITIEKLQ